MKAFFVAAIIPLALLLSFRESNGRRELADFKTFVGLCVEAGTNFCSLHAH